MSICPNINTPEWRALEEAVGKIEAYRDFMETDGDIRTPQEVTAKIISRKESAYDINNLPKHTRNTKYVNPDGSKRLAGTDGKTITINPVENVSEFFDYITGAIPSATSEQKVQVLAELGKIGYDLNRIHKLLDTPEKVNAFLVLHEQNHIDNNDKDVYWLNTRDLLTPDKIAIEVRATVVALNAIERAAPDQSTTQQAEAEAQNLNISQTAVPGAPAETSVMTQAMLNDRADNSVQPETTEHVAAVELANKMSAMLGVGYQLVSAAEAKVLTANAKNPWSEGDIAFFVGGRVYFVGDNLTMENVFHEFSHPFVRHLQNTKPELINNLYTQLSNTPEGQATIREVKELYPFLDATDPLFQEEVIVKALTTAGLTKMNKDKLRSPFAKAIANIMYAIKQAIRKIFGNASSISKLDADSSMRDLADMLVKGGKIQLDVESISQEDIVAYNKERTEFINEMTKVAKGEIQSQINEFAKIAKDHKNKVGVDKNYMELNDILTDVTEQSDLDAISSNLRAYQTDIATVAKKDISEIDDITARSTAFVNSLFRLDLVMAKIHDHITDIHKEGESQANLQKGYYYMHLIENWETFSKEAREGLRKSGIKRDSPLIALLGQIDTSIASSKDLINEMYAEGARDTLYAELMPMHQNIKARYDKRIQDLKDAKAPQERIDREYKAYHGVTEAEQEQLSSLRARTNLSVAEKKTLDALERASFNGVAISPEKIERILKGGIGDANFFNSYLEGYLYNTDPVIGGLASYVKNNMNEVMAKVQVKYNDFAKDLQPAMEEAGVNQYKPGELGEKVGFLDKVGMIVDGKVELREVWTFLNPFKDYRYDEAKYKQAVDDAKEEYQQTGTAEAEQAMTNAIAAQKKFKRDYFHQQYTDEYYDAAKILHRGEGDVIGDQALLMRERWDEEMRALTETATTPEQQLAIMDQQDQLWRDFRQMRSRYNLDGSLKKDIPSKGIYDASVAERLRDYQEATRDFAEWVPKKGSFQNALNAYEQELIDTNTAKPGTQKFKDMRAVWIAKNTTKAPLQSYYDNQRKDYERLSEILSKLPKSEKDMLDESAIHEEIFELTGPFRDADGQIKANEMSRKSKQKVKALEEKLITMRKAAVKRNGLTAAQNNRLSELHTLQQAGKWNKDLLAERNSLYALKEKYGLTPFELREVNAIQARLSGISKREATAYYVDIMQTWLDQLKVDDPTVKNIDVISAEWVLRPEIINQLLGQNKDFDEWFKENHIQKDMYSKEAKGSTKQWVRTKVWSSTVPVDNTQYETTELYNEQGEVTEVIQGKPILKYFNRVVKPEYKNEKILGVTVDNQGKWLPKTVAQGAVSNKYINDEYHALKQSDPKLFTVLEKLTKHHLENQEGLNYRGRLYLDFPRYRKDNLELLQGGNLLTNLIQRIKDWYHGSADDAEQGLNDKAGLDLVRSDMFDNDITKVPIHGLYNIDHKDVSTNITKSMMQYMLSGERQKQLVKISPVARAVQSVVTANKRNKQNTEGIDQIDKDNFYNRQIKTYKKMTGDGVRKKAVDNFLEREFEGKRITGAGADSALLNNTASLLFKRASFGFFAFNIPSALKNSYGAKFQGMIEASAGEYMTHRSFQKGNGWSYGAMAELSFGGQLYQKGPKSHKQQLLQIFDPSQGRTEEQFGEGLSRTVATDAANLDVLYNFRKWVELQATFQIFGGMMYHQKVEMTMPDGTVQEIPYMDAWETRNEQIQLKEGVDPKWGITLGKDGEVLVGDEFKRYKNKVHQVMNNLQGAYSSFDQPEAQRYLVFRFLSYLRRYFTTMTLNRFGFSGRWNDPQPRLNPGLGDVQTGFYITFLRMVKDTISRGGKNLLYMTDIEKQATMRMITEVGMLVAASVAMSLLFGWDPDDEDKFVKLRERSGSLPFPLTSDDPDRPFNGWGFVENHMLFLLMNIRAENEQFIPLPGYGLDDYSAMLDLKSIAFGPTVKTYKDIIEDALDILEGNESANYRRTTGPYDWQQEGSAKIFAHLARTAGLTGSALDPAKAIKGFQSVQARAR